MNIELQDNEKALWVLKTRGPQPLAVIANELNVTTEGARFHLIKLEKEGLVESRSEAQGRGRPKQIWSVTEKGNSRFPDNHANLTVNIIDMMRNTLGEDSVHRVIEEHEARMLSRYQEEIDKSSSLENRLEKLAEIRTREGYMAEFEKDKEGYLFIENHCPICAAAKICQGFCQAELNIFRVVLGDKVNIERVEHIVKGERRCAYRIS